MEIELASDVYKNYKCLNTEKAFEPSICYVVEVQSILSSGRVGFGLVLGAKETPYSQ